ncbi:MFS transporter [Streptomyces sp. B1I3]|uniref:MFS transporter n=1 Tax=Streptomyces sp. B1I3 TaxID=3042264 RepID=UPI002784C772|nr:MFS transporter [Streptomyces sp. B1I3]MDQ0791668.1 MFS family permease [Streptomyces sp. B1I3]
MTAHRSLWGNRDFTVFWAGDTVAQFGSQITLLAVPLTAAVTLHVDAKAMGVLNAASYLPFLVLTLFAGVWADRYRRRPVMLASTLCRAALLSLIPLLFALDRLNLGYLVAVAIAVGVFTVLFEVTYQSYLPSLVDREDLMEGNSKLQVSASTAQVGGPALAGWLAGWLTPQTAILVSAVAFAISAGGLALVRKREPAPERPAEPIPVRRQIAEGLRFTFGNRVLRACVLEAATYNMFWLVLETVFLLYATRNMGISPGTVGLILGGGAVGSLVGSLVAKRISERLGLGNTVTLAMVTGCAAPVLVPLADGPRPVVLGLLLLSFFVGGAGTMVANIQVVSLRQTITPHAMLGRMNASYRFVSWGVVPLGALLGGWLGDSIGLRPAMFVGAAGIFASALWIVFSPIRAMRELPPAADDEAADDGSDGEDKEKTGDPNAETVVDH